MIDNPVQWFQSKTVDLENESKKKGALFDMKSILLNSEKKVLKEIVYNVSINPVFECLFTSDEQEIELICVIFFELLSEMSAKELIERYAEQLHRSLLHNSDVVKGTVLKLLEKNVTEGTIEILVKKHTPLLVDVAGCLSSKERSTAQGAISMFINMGNYPLGVNTIFSTDVLKKLKEIIAGDDTARFRVYEIIVAISKLSAENLSASDSSDIMAGLITEISSSDILIQLNALEMLSGLATSNHGLNYLQEHHVIQNLVDKLVNLNDEPLSFMLLPGLIEFFGNLCTLQPEYFTKEYPQIMTLLFKSLETTDEILLGVITSSVGKIGSTRSGRIVLSKYESEMKHFFKVIGELLVVKKDLTINIMNSLCELLKNISGNDEANHISNKWFDSITPNALDSITTHAKLPFIEFKLSAFALLKAISTQEWGIRILCRYPGMIEFLTDRYNEFNKDCKQIKYEVVCNMVQSPIIEEEVSQQVLLNLKEFVKEGPFYVPAQVEMATEGAE